MSRPSQAPHPNEGHAKLTLYDVKKHGRTRYFSKHRVSGTRTGRCFDIGEWQVTCPG